VVNLWWIVWQRWSGDGHFFVVEKQDIFLNFILGLLLRGGRGGGIGGLAARVGTEDKECRDGGDDDADDDEDQERIGEACSLARRSGGEGHGWLDARTGSFGGGAKDRFAVEKMSFPLIENMREIKRFMRSNNFIDNRMPDDLNW
jgi:hypothetical protein